MAINIPKAPPKLKTTGTWSKVYQLPDGDRIAVLITEPTTPNDEVLYSMTESTFKKVFGV